MIWGWDFSNPILGWDFSTINPTRNQERSGFLGIVYYRFEAVEKVGCSPTMLRKKSYRLPGPPKKTTGLGGLAPRKNNTPPKTNTSHLKMDGWKTTFLLGRPIFRYYVSFRECNKSPQTHRIKKFNTACVESSLRSSRRKEFDAVAAIQI